MRLRIEDELSRYTVVHQQLLALEGERNRAIRESLDTTGTIARRLLRLKAIAESTAETLSREVFFRGFRNRRQIGAYSGLTPTPYQSGEMSHESGISRAGNHHVRGILIDLTWAWLRYQPGNQLSRWYQRRFGSGGPRMRKIGIVALARKLLIILWRYAENSELPQGARFKPLPA